MTPLLHDPAPDDALRLALEALDPHLRDCARAVERAAGQEDWQAVLMAIDAFANAGGEALEGPLLASLLLGAGLVAALLPASAVPPEDETKLKIVRKPPTGFPDDLETAHDAVSVLPLAQAAVEAMKARDLVTPDRMRQLSGEAQTRSLAVAGSLREAALAKLQPILEEQAAAPSLAAFKRRLRETGLAEDLAGGAAETAFRTAIATAYHDGMDRLLEDPDVGSAFPYIETLPIKDSRLSEVCALASKGGIHGGAIYRRDDPAWTRVRPPRHFNCRCGSNPLTAEMAAAKGVGAGAGHVTLSPRLLKLLGA